MAKVNPIQVQKFLGGLDYPATREDVVKRATEQGADKPILEMLQRLPDEQFETPADVSQAIGRLD
jgi:hypothetical protein